MTSDVFFTLFYLLMSFGLIFPPQEFVSVGFTIQNIFGNVLGSEKERFVRYHIRKTLLNLLIYSCLPLIYIMSLFIFGFADEIKTLFWGSNPLWRIYAASSIALPCLALFQIKLWSDDNYSNHPIVLNIRKCCNNNNSWEDVASNIETEFRRLEILSLNTNPIIKVVVTDNWIIKAVPLNLYLAHQSDTTVNVVEVNNYQSGHMGADETQFLNIEVKSNRSEKFVIRINSQDFRDLENRLARSINLSPGVKFHKTVVEQFLEVFKDNVKNNPKYHTDIELDQCIGCLQAAPSIKLQKQCSDSNIGNDNNCTSCFCRPMWCTDCIGKWFVSKQDPNQKTEWLSCKCTCPMCRAIFCMLDVCPLDNTQE